MLRSAAAKVMWVGRATVFMVGLAVILAVVFGVASMAFAGNGDAFKLGRNNTASALSKRITNGVSCLPIAGVMVPRRGNRQLDLIFGRCSPRFVVG